MRNEVQHHAHGGSLTTWAISAATGGLNLSRNTPNVLAAAVQFYFYSISFGTRVINHEEVKPQSLISTSLIFFGMKTDSYFFLMMFSWIQRFIFDEMKKKKTSLVRGNVQLLEPIRCFTQLINTRYKTGVQTTRVQ